MAESYLARRHRLQRQHLQADGRFRQAQSRRSMSILRHGLKATTLSSRIDHTSSESRREQSAVPPDDDRGYISAAARLRLMSRF
jgi:hypothetical protein